MAPAANFRNCRRLFPHVVPSFSGAEGFRLVSICALLLPWTTGLAEGISAHFRMVGENGLQAVCAWVTSNESRVTLPNAPSIFEAKDAGLPGKNRRDTHKTRESPALRSEDQNRHRGSGHPLSRRSHPACGSAPGGSVRGSPCGPEVRLVFRHKGFATRQVCVSASPSSEPVELSRS